MSNVPGSSVPVQQEGIQTGQPVSESAAFSIAGVANYTLTNGGKIGDIVNSMLTETAFQTLRDTTWVLADGRDITGSDLAALTGNNTCPDFRGVYIRGCDNGRALDPNGEQAPGAYIADQYASHDHQIFVGNTTTGSDNRIEQLPDAGGGYIGGTVGGEPAVQPNGGAETAPKTTYANIFIKINT